MKKIEFTYKKTRVVISQHGPTLLGHDTYTDFELVQAAIGGVK